MPEQMPWEEFKDTDGVATPSRGVFIPDVTAAQEQERARAEERRAEEAARRAAAGELRSQQAEARAQAEFTGEGGKPTEAQQKTAVLLTRIKGGFQDIQNVIGRNPEAQEAGLGETLVQNVFGEGLLSRAISGPDRRIVKDAQKDVLDALLTLGTGAAYTREQLESQTVGYFPQYNDSPEEIAAKNNRMARLIEAAKINAGPKWGEVEAAITPFLPKAEQPTTDVSTGVVPKGDQPTFEEYRKDFPDAVRLVYDDRGVVTGHVDSNGLYRETLIEADTSLTPEEEAQLLQERDTMMGAIDTFGRGIADVASFGLADEIAAGLNTAFDSGSFQQNLARERAIDRIDQEVNPYASLGGTVVGALALPTGIGRAAATGGIRGAAVRGAQEGAVYGGAYGFGSGEDMQGRLANVATGVGLGGLTGGLGGALAGRLSRPAEAASRASEAAPSASGTASELEAIAELGRKAVTLGIGQSKAKRELAKMAKVNPEATAQAERLGVELPTDILSDDTELQSLMGLARSQVGSEAETAWKLKTAEVAQKAEESVREVGASPSIAQVSEDVFAKLEGDMEALQKQGDLLRREVNETVDIRERVDAGKTRASLTTMIDDLGGGVEGKEALSAEEKKLLSMLEGPDGPRSPTYARLNQVRDQIGEALTKGKGPWVDTPTKNLKKYYGALAEDQIGHIEAVGGKELADKMRASNSIFTQMFDIRNDMVSVFGKDLEKGIAPLIRSAVSGGAKGDVTALNKLVNAIPQDMRKEVLLTGLLSENMAKSGAGGFSFNNFAKTYRGVRENPPIYKMFAKEIGDGDKILADLYGISKRMLAGEAKVLKTGKANQAALNALNGESLTAKILKGTATRAATTVGGGVAGGPVGAGLAMAASETIAKMGGQSKSDAVHRLLSSSEFKALIEKVAAGNTSDATVNSLARSRPFNIYADKIGLSKKFKDRAEWIKTAFVTAVAEGNQE